MKGKSLIIIGTVAVAILFLFSKNGIYKNPNQQGVDIQGNTVKLVGSSEFYELIKDEKSFVLDVHIPEQTHIPGTDAFIPYNQIKQNTEKLPADKSTPILVYCKTGSMSKTASDEIARLGYTNVFDLEGGIEAYKKTNSEVAITPGNRDLGEVVYGDISKTAFTLTNFTPLPLNITRISTSCGCTTAEATKIQVPAYNSTQIEVSFDPAIHGDATDVGEVTRSIYIDTDNPHFRKLSVTITASVVKK
jgi:rhodanese-related sulfurtransferase